MALILHPTHVPFSIERLLRMAWGDLFREGRDVLEFFDLGLERVPVPGHWRPSRLHRCMRKQIYMLHGVQREKPAMDFLSESRFTRGKVFGPLAQAHVLNLEGRYGITNVSSEDVVFDPVTDLGGKTDGSFFRNGVQYLVEVKSKEKLLPASFSPEDYALQQLNDYMGMTGVRHGFLLYFGPTRHGKNAQVLWFREFPVEFSQQRWQKTLDRIAQLSAFAKNPKLIAPATGNKWFECGNCAFAGLCQRNVPSHLAPKK